MSEPSPSECPFARARWREDFPVEWEADHYVTRRELARSITNGSALLAVAGVALCVVSLRNRNSSSLPIERVASVDQVPPGGSLLFRYPTKGDACILVRKPNGEFRAYSQVCTHLSCALVHRKGSEALLCPCHHGEFEVETGVPIAGPPTRRLPQILLEQRDGELFAVGVEG